MGRLSLGENMKRYTIAFGYVVGDDLVEDIDGDFIYYADHLEVVEDLNAKIKLLVDHIEFMNEKMDQLKDLL
jgi:hypothetical protein